KGTATVTGISVSFYGATNLRASAAGTDDALNTSVSFSKDLDVTTIPDITIASLTNRLSVTSFVGDKGFEISDFTTNYKKGTATVTGISVSFYGATNLRASAAGTDDALNTSVSFSKDLDVTTIPAITIASLTNRLSVTSFVGDKGFEISDFTTNYKKGTATVTGISVSFYGATNLRASAAGTDDAL